MKRILFSVLPIVAVCSTGIAQAGFVIDNFEQGGAFSLTANQANLSGSNIASPIGVPGALRRVTVSSPDSPGYEVNAVLTATAGDDALAFSGMNPPNSGFSAAGILYGSAAGQPSLHLNLTPHGDRFYLQLANDTASSGYYISLLLDSAGTGVFDPTIPGAPGSANFITPNGSGRYEILFSYFTDIIGGTAFNPGDIDGIQIAISSGEVRDGNLPLMITEFGVVPEPTGIALLASGFCTLIAFRRIANTVGDSKNR